MKIGRREKFMRMGGLGMYPFNRRGFTMTQEARGRGKTRLTKYGAGGGFRDVWSVVQ